MKWIEGLNFIVITGNEVARSFEVLSDTHGRSVTFCSNATGPPLSLLSPAVLVWNTVRMGEIVARLRAVGEAVSEEDLARISPQAYAHVIPNGTYGFDRPQQSQPLPPLGGWDGSALTASSRQALNNSGAASPVCSAAR
jgi:hypothetical protein